VANVFVFNIVVVSVENKLDSFSLSCFFSLNLANVFVFNIIKLSKISYSITHFSLV
jgi:hypothetical protein